MKSTLLCLKYQQFSKYILEQVIIRKTLQILFYCYKEQEYCFARKKEIVLAQQKQSIPMSKSAVFKIYSCTSHFQKNILDFTLLL